MKNHALTRALLAFTAVTLFSAKAASAADVRVMISAGFHGVYAELAPAFEKASGHRLITARGPSMGDSPEAIPARLARGEAADVGILDGEAATTLAERGLVRAESKAVLARSQVGMVVRACAAKPDISAVEAFKSTLLAAKSIAYSDSGSGTYLSTKLFAKLGVAEQIAGKSRKVRGPPSGEPVAAVVARGDAEIGFQQVSELIHTPGVTFVGALPEALQPGFTFAAAITRDARETDAATALIRFLTSSEAATTIVKAGLMPPLASVSGMSAAECAVWARERSFARSVDDHDVKAFVEHLHPGAVFNAGTGTPTRGTEAVAKDWAGIIEGKRINLRWRAQFVNIGGEPDIAISRGPYMLEDPWPEAKTRYRVGHYVSVWKKDARSGVWQVLFDGGGPAPTAVENKVAADKFLAQAPERCVAQ